jgi:hypothetical protein
MVRWTAVLAGMCVLVGCSTVPRSFQPLEPLAVSDFSYQPLNATLQAHVKDGVVNYPAIARDDRFQLHLWQLDRIDPYSLPTRQDRLAFWINAYNVFAIKGILDGYSPMTLFGRYRYFIARDYHVGGRSINLYDLEQKLLIPDFKEPRIHFAIVCASKSCPKLRSEVYSAERLDEQLEQSARAFINDFARNRFDRGRKTAYLSMIFKWFEHDFIEHSGSVLRYIRRYLDDSDLGSELSSYRVEFLDYDWNLNGMRYARPR